jgi:hypothetical protein
MIKEKHKLVYIEWVDSQGPTGTWRYLNESPLEMKKEDLLCKSVGWLIYSGKDCKRIIPHLSGEGKELQGRGDLAIPSKAILKITELKPTR